MNKCTGFPSISKQQSLTKNEISSAVSQQTSRKGQIIEKRVNLTHSQQESSKHSKQINASINLNGSKLPFKGDQLSQIIDDPPATAISICNETCSTRFGRSAKTSAFWTTCYKPEINEELFSTNNFSKFKRNRGQSLSEDKQLRLTGPEKLWNLFTLTEEKKTKNKSDVQQYSFVADTQEYPWSRSISKSTPKKKIEKLQNSCKAALVSKNTCNSPEKNTPSTSLSSPKNQRKCKLDQLSETLHLPPSQDSFPGNKRNLKKSVIQITDCNSNDCLPSDRNRLVSQQSTIFCMRDEGNNRQSQLRSSGLYDSISDEMNISHDKLWKQFKEHNINNVGLMLNASDQEKCENYHKNQDNCQKVTNESRINYNQSVYVGVDGLKNYKESIDSEETGNNNNTSKSSQKWISFKGRILDLLRMDVNTKTQNVHTKYKAIKDIIDSARKHNSHNKLENYWKKIKQIFDENSDTNHTSQGQEYENKQQEYLTREELISYLGTITQKLKLRNNQHKTKKSPQSLSESKQPKIAMIDQQLKDYFERLKHLNCSKSIYFK